MLRAFFATSPALDPAGLRAALREFLSAYERGGRPLTRAERAGMASLYVMVQAAETRTCTTALALLGGTPVRTRPWPPSPAAGQAEAAAARVLTSGRWGGIVPGGECAALEERLAGYLGASHVVTVSSGAAGLTAALLAAGIGPGDEVIVPAMTYIATATAVTWCGAVPVFADIDPATHALDPVAAAGAVTARTRAVTAVHLGGHPADTDALAAIASDRGIVLIEDCAQSLGATWNGAHTGLAGAAGVLSFAATKNITAGEGGAVITRDPVLTRRAAALRDHGRAPGGGHQTLGANLRMTKIQAAILSAQLTRLDGHLAAKEEAAAWLARELGGIPGVQPVPAGRDPRVPHRLAAVLQVRRVHPRGPRPPCRNDPVRGVGERLLAQPGRPHLRQLADLGQQRVQSQRARV